MSGPPAALLSALAALACSGPGDDSGATAPPSLAAPQVARHEAVGSILRVSWEQDEAGPTWIRYRVDPETWLETPVVERQAGAQEQLVVGLPYAWEVKLQLVVDTGQQEARSPAVLATTAPLPEATPAPTMVVHEPELMDPDTPFILVAANEPGNWNLPWWTMILDRRGRVVWARESDELTSTIFPRPSADGRSLMLDQSTFWTLFDLGQLSEIVSVQLDGTELGRWSAPGLHHDFTDLPDGTLLWGANDGQNEDLVERSPDGSERVIWSCGPDSGRGLCSSNSLHWEEATDTLLFSLVNQNAVVELDRSTGQVLRWFGAEEGAYAFDPPDSQFYKAHSVELTADGTLLLSCWNAEEGTRLMVREYDIDADAEELHQVWSFTHELALFAPLLGDVARLPGGNTLHSTGRSHALRELTADGEIAWDLRWPEDSDVGRVSPLADLYALLPD